MPNPRKEKFLEMFNHSARVAGTFGMKLSFDEQDRAVIRLPYNPRLDHAMGQTHGGVIATMLDCAGWFTCAVVHEGEGWMVTSEMSFHLLRPAEKSDLWARGSLIKSGKRQDVAEMHCFDESGNLIAQGSGTYIYLDERPMNRNGR